MRTYIDVPAPRTKTVTARIVVIDGFGQHPECPVTHEVAAALAHAFPTATVPAPIPTATAVAADITLQHDFTRQARSIHRAITASPLPTHVYAYSQACIPTAALLAHHRYVNVASVMLVGAPLRASRERRRVAELDACGMGGVFEYVDTHLPADAGRLSGVVVFQPATGNRLYVGLTEDYTRGFPADDPHYRNLVTTTSRYPTTLVGCGAETFTDCTPVNLAALAAAAHIPLFTDHTVAYGRSCAVIIPGAPHRLGREHRTVTLPRLYRRRTTLRELTGTTP